MDDLDFFDAMIKGQRIELDAIYELNKSRLNHICGWLRSCGYVAKAYELEFLFIGAIAVIENRRLRRPLI